VSAALLALALAGRAQGASLYWDSDGSTAGGSAGTTADGTWGADSYWNTSSSGAAGTFTAATTASDDLTFSAGTDVTAASLITVNGTQVANSITVEEGSPTFAGGAISLTTGFTKTVYRKLLFRHGLPVTSFWASEQAPCSLIK